MGAWARAGWRVWDLGNGTIMLQKLFNPEWQIPSKSFLLSSFLIGFSFSPTAEISRLELEFEESLPRKTASKRGLDRSQMEQPIMKNKFSYFARSRLRLRPQEIWERDYLRLFSHLWCNTKMCSIKNYKWQRHTIFTTPRLELNNDWNVFSGYILFAWVVQFKIKLKFGTQCYGIYVSDEGSLQRVIHRTMIDDLHADY